MIMDLHTKLMEWFYGIMAGIVIIAIFVGFLFLPSGCSTVQVNPGCEDSWADDVDIGLAMNVGAIGLSEYLIQNPDHRQDAKNAIKAALIVLSQDVVTLDVVVSALQKGISSKEVRSRLGYIAILGTVRQSGVVLNACEREYLASYFQRLLLMVG